VATYEENSPTAFDLAAADAGEVAREVYDHGYEHAVCSAGVAGSAGEFDVAVYNGE
jgi:IMP cyclohydrolase